MYNCNTPGRYFTAGHVDAFNDTPYPPHKLDMGMHPPLFLLGLLPGHPRYPGSEKAEEKWRLIHSSKSVTITSQIHLLPVSRPGEQLPVTLHPHESSLFYVDAEVSAAQAGAGFDFYDHNLLSFEEVYVATDFKMARVACKQRAGVTPPATCYSNLRIPSEFFLKFDRRTVESSLQRQLRLNSRVLYKAVSVLSITIAHAHGEPTVIDLESPIYFTAFRQKISFAYLVQAEGAFDTTHLETPQSLAIVAQWRFNTTQQNAFYLPNRCPVQTVFNTNIFTLNAHAFCSAL